MKNKNFLFKIILVFTIIFSLIILDVKFTLNFRPLYYFDIEQLHIEKESELSLPQIKENYNYVIDYLNPGKKIDFKLPSLDFSREGKIHFEEVKKIFTKLDSILCFSIFWGIISTVKLLPLKDYSFLKWSSFGLLALPLFLIFPFIINFDKSFTFFHEIFFRNKYWEFDPVMDPIITILPQDFFFHCALMILLILFIQSLLLIFWYKFSSKKTKASDTK